MNKKSIKILALAVMSFLFLGGSAFAEFEVLNYAKIYMTSGAGTTDKRTEFDFNEQPWLYISFKEGYGATDRVGGSTTDTTWTWDGTPTDQSFPKFYMANKNDLWIGFSSDYWKNNMQLAGDWVVSASSILNDKTLIPGAGVINEYAGEVRFKVNPVPEPISGLLFLAGGAAIAAFKRSKKA